MANEIERKTYLDGGLVKKFIKKIRTMVSTMLTDYVKTKDLEGLDLGLEAMTEEELNTIFTEVETEEAGSNGE